MKKSSTYLINKKLILLTLLMLLSVGQGFAGGNTNYYATLTATTSETGKGLVYAATSNKAPTADNQYKTSVTADKGKQDSPSFTYYAWAKPARGYLFNGWSSNRATVGNNPTGNGDAITVSGSEDEKNKTDGKVTANWKDAPSFTITYKQPENKGQYSVRYDYTAIVNNAFTAGSETYTMSASTVDKPVKSYAADKVTLSTSLSSFLGWYDGDTQLSTDKEYTYTISKNATITARFEAPKEYQVSVTSNGTTTQYKTIQEALAAANKLDTNPTVTLLDNITGVEEILTISKSMTLDLNGFTLSGKGGPRAPNKTSDLSKELLWINGSKINVTIKDGSTAKTGTINCTDEINHDLYGIRVDNGTLTLENGTMHAENTDKYEGNTTRMRTYTVYAAPGCTINQKGATIEAVGDYYAYGILTGGWYSGSGPATVNISGGTINASAFNSPRGIDAGYANINVTGGEINANATGGNWSSYGISLNAYANAQKKNEWHATLIMSGGTVNASSTTSAARGIRVNRAVAYSGNTNTVASIVAAEATITGGNVNATTTTSGPVAVEPYGPTTISGGTITAKAGTTDAYGVRTMDGKTIINGSANITATAQTNNAFGATAGADTDGSMGTPYEGELQIDGSTITATATNGATARGVFVQSASRNITNTASGYFKGQYAAAGKATINGGKISAKAKNNGAASFFISGTSTNGSASATPTASITGGWFKASGTNAVSVNNLASTKDLTITGGDFQQNSYISDYVPKTKTVYAISGGEAYNFGCRYYVTDWDYTKDIAKNTSTNKTYTSVKTALDEATSGQTVVIIENCKMNEQATVKNGVKLLVPYDDAYTWKTTKADVTQSWTTPSAFKTLTMSDGASIDVQNGGALCVGGKQYSSSNEMSAGSGGPGSPVGPFGCIDMSDGGKITLESGSALYAWGFITGQNMYEGNNTTGVGSIEAKDGSTVYEDIVIADWHGGSATSGMDSKKKYFPFNQYFIPNIEVPLTINYGATLNTVSDISAGLTTKEPFSVPVIFIAKSGGLFNMLSESSTAKVWYDARTDTQHFEFTGDNNLTGIAANIKTGFGTVQLDASKYVMPMTSNFDIHIKSGSITIPSDVALLPGAKVTLDEGVKATIKKDVNLYIYDLDNWGLYAYRNYRKVYPFRPTKFKQYGQGDKNTKAADVAKVTGLSDAKLVVNGKLTVNGAIYTTNAGADICSDKGGSIVFATAPTASDTTYQYVHGGNPAEVAIPVTAPQLHNADGSYVNTTGAEVGTTFYYNPSTGKWSKTDPSIVPPTFKYNDKGHGDFTLTNATNVTVDQVKSEMGKETDPVLSVDLTNATGNIDLASLRSTIDDATGNSNVLLYVATANTNNVQNVVTKGANGNYTAANFVITDKQPIDIPTAFTAAKVSYSRTNTKNSGDTQWGTICLPFELTSGNGIQYYELKNVSGNTMTFERVDKVAANTPAIYSVASDVKVLAITGSGMNIAVTPAESNYAQSGFTLVGVQKKAETLKDGSNNYYIAKNKFWKPTGTNVNVGPQRAYFQINGNSGLAKVFNIALDDGKATGIDNATIVDGNEPAVIGIYSINGVKQTELRPGINIIKMSDGTTKKIIIK